MAVRTPSGILAEIVETKRQEVADLRERAAALELEAHQRKVPPGPFAKALTDASPAIIAEIKKASPSRGLWQPAFHPAFIAHAYEERGAACLSVLTDKQYSQSSLQDMRSWRASVSLTVLRR